MSAKRTSEPAKPEKKDVLVDEKNVTKQEEALLEETNTPKEVKSVEPEAKQEKVSKQVPDTIDVTGKFEVRMHEGKHYVYGKNGRRISSAMGEHEANDLARRFTENR